MDRQTLKILSIRLAGLQSLDGKSACETGDFDMFRVFATALFIATLVAIPMESFATPYYANKKVVTIRGDHGGVMLAYALKAKKMARAGTQVRIGGRCDSACTLYLGLPRNQVCVFPGASFRFHKPYGGSAKANHAAAKFMMRNYPGWVRNWINRNGGLTSRLKTMPYSYVSQYVSSCYNERQRPKRARATLIAFQPRGR